MLEVSAKALVQPSAWRRYDSGPAAAIAPSWPDRPVSWVTIGPCRTRNHAVTRRITLTKTMASPAPTTARASTAPAKDPEKAKPSWPTVISTSPQTSIAREPKRSSRTPTGTCMPAYTTSWRTVNVARLVALMWKRSAAMIPATPSELRWKTART